jgi:mycothiol synthase
VSVGAAPVIRDVTEGDAAAVLDLIVLCDLAEIGEPDYTIDDVEADLARTTHRGLVAVGPDGEVEGYGWVERRTNHTAINADVMVRPGSDPGLLGRLLDDVLAAARDIDRGLAVQVFVSSANRMKSALLESAGARVVRHFWRMTVDLPDSPPPQAPDLPPGVEVRLADSGEADLRAVHRVLDSAFLDHFGNQSSTFEDWAPTHTTGSWADFSLWWLATVDGVPAAAQIAANPTGSGGYIADLGTLPAYRGRGLGRALLLTAFAEFHRRGLRTVSLGVDATNPTGAVALYESVGMAARHEFATYELSPA